MLKYYKTSKKSTAIEPESICPCCGQLLIPQDHIVLPPTKKRILDVVRRHPGIDAETLRGLVWADDPNGGPENPKAIHVHVHQLNRRLQLHGIRVRGSCSGGYRIVAISNPTNREESI